MLNTHALINPSPSDRNLSTKPADEKLTFRQFNSSKERKLMTLGYNENQNILNGGGIMSLKVPATSTDKITNVISLNGLHSPPLPHYDFWNSSMAPQANPLTS